MCGIAGIIRKKDTVDRVELKRMTDSIIHRGPDSEGFWLEENIGFGFRRLAIIDLSPSANQPMLSHDKRFVLIFNGEIYNYQELKEQLEAKGYKFRTKSDTEVLLNMFVEYGHDMMQYLDGMFAFAIWDRKTKQLTAARDRAGEKPFYFYFDNKTFVFASEIKAIKAAGIALQYNYKRIISFFNDRTNVRNLANPQETFFDNIKQLPAGKYIILDKNFNLTIKSYWELNFSCKENYPLQLEQATEKLNELLTNSVKKRLKADVKVGSSLSGGLDSSAIVRTINDIAGENVQQMTFSAKFPDFEKDESNYIDLLTEFLKVKNFATYPSATEFADDFQKLMYHQEEPFPSTSIYAQWKVMQLAAQNNVTVLLDGQGADELFAGYRHYLKIAAGQTQAGNLHHKNKKFRKPRIYYKIKFAHHDVNSELLSIFFNSETSEIVKPTDCLNKRLAFDYQNAILPNLLRYADKNSMAFSREVRLPYLSKDLIEFAFQLPTHFKIKNQTTKYILRNAFKNKLPDEIIYRKDKIGFEAPMEQWLKELENIKKDAYVYLEKIKFLNPKRQNFEIKGRDWQLISLYFFFKNYENR